MQTNEIHKHVKCCACEGELPTNPTWVRLPVQITWRFPQWGNVLEHSMGVAFLCDSCAAIDDISQVKYAVEFVNDTDVKYHQLQWNWEDCELLD